MTKTNSKSIPGKLARRGTPAAARQDANRAFGLRGETVKRIANAMHYVGFDRVLACGPRVHASHIRVTEEIDTFLRWEPRERCEGCERAIQARRAELLREVAEIEARDAAKAAAKAA